MFKTSTDSSALVGFALLLIFALALPVPASADIGSVVDALDLMRPGCPSGTQAKSELNQFKHKIASAETVAQAREMALAPTDMAIKAIIKANAMLPFSDDLRKAETRLSNARSRILLASSREQISDAFAGTMLAGLDDDSAVRVGNGGCNYSTGEVIAIIVGLILGIIPGLILLVVLC